MPDTYENLARRLRENKRPLVDILVEGECIEAANAIDELVKTVKNLQDANHTSEVRLNLALKQNSLKWMVM